MIALFELHERGKKDRDADREHIDQAINQNVLIKRRTAGPDYSYAVSGFPFCSFLAAGHMFWLTRDNADITTIGQSFSDAGQIKTSRYFLGKIYFSYDP